MTVKDKKTGKILTTKSLWLTKEWKRSPKRFLTAFKTEEPKELKEITKEKSKKDSDK